MSILLFATVAAFSVGGAAGIILPAVHAKDVKTVLNVVPSALKRLLKSIRGLFLLSFKKFDDLVSKMLKKIVLGIRALDGLGVDHSARAEVSAKKAKTVRKSRKISKKRKTNDRKSKRSASASKNKSRGK